MLHEQAKLLAAYNQWINNSHYTLCATLSDHERKTDRRSFFKSIHGVLNHMLLGDRLWMGRFENHPISITNLDEELFRDFDLLHEARVYEDTRICDWADKLDDAFFERPIQYNAITDPGTVSCTGWIAVTHFFNHQAHHRGQLTGMLAQAGLDYGVTDLIAMPDVLTR